MVEADDEDAVALIRMVVVNLLINAMDHQDVTSSFRLDPWNDVEASFYTYVDVAEENDQDDVD